MRQKDVMWASEASKPRFLMTSYFYSTFVQKHLDGALFRFSVPEPASDLVEVALVHGLGDVPDLAALVGLPLLLVELLRQRLQLGQGHLQGQAVGVANWRVLQHVLAEESHVIARRTDLPEPLQRRG